MRKAVPELTAILCLILVICPSAGSAERSEPVIIDHTCTEIENIPETAIQDAKENCKWHYVRMSHGRQIMVGLDMLEDQNALYKSTWPPYGGSLPEDPDALCIYTLAGGPYDYWDGSGMDNTRDILDDNPTLSVSSLCWCTELNTASEAYVQRYLDSMQVLENEYPEVTFVYFTGTAEYDGGYGYNRALRNSQIRDFCMANNKVLFDFENLDSWWYNPDNRTWEQATYEYEGEVIPVEHPNLAGDDAEHTSYESCEQKGRATWWMMAVLGGLGGTNVTDGGEQPPADRPGISQLKMKCYPNPCNPSTTIEFVMAQPSRAELSIYDPAGKKVMKLLEGFLSGGTHTVFWSGENSQGEKLASGVYLYNLRSGKHSVTRKILLLR